MANQSSQMENLVSFDALQAFYKGKKVFLTGHTGFKGAWLLACLNKMGAEVTGYALPPEYENGLFSLLGSLENFKNIYGDIRDKEFLEKELHACQPELVFHLAAQPLVRRSYEKPADTFDVNVTGTANLLESVARLKGTCSVVAITTDKVYENKELDIHYREEDVLGGYDPYSASKACTELVISSFRNSFFNPSKYATHHKAIVSARAGNVIGGGDWSEDRIIPDIVRSLMKNKPVEVRNPSAVRPWQHVLEPLNVYLQLGRLFFLQPQDYSTAYNIGPSTEDHLAVREVVEAAISTWGSGQWIDRSSNEQPHEAGLLKLDISRIGNELGWKPKLDSKKAIAWTIEWYKKPVNEQAGFSFRQIEEFYRL